VAGGVALSRAKIDGEQTAGWGGLGDQPYQWRYADRYAIDAERLRCSAGSCLFAVSHRL